ncbi:hypothetical protein [Pseudomonas sp. S1(2024)]|uniref:hypothetical protein n=1 Tax=Pseudomonas sp. S1(2024) TaxID=3390191 RepID=UPI0039796714
MATRNTQEQTVKASVLPAVGDPHSKPMRRLSHMHADVERAHATCQGLNLFQGDLEAFKVFLCSCDPTREGKYLRWILNRMNRQTPERVFDLDFDRQGLAARKTLLAFSVKSQYLPLEQRDILAYQSLREVGLVLAEHAESFNTISNVLLASLDAEEVFERTLILEHERLSVCDPQTIEETAALLGNPQWLDSRGKGFYRKLKSLGKIFLLLSDFGVQVLVRPHASNERGIVYDCTGELSLIEDALAHHDLTYEEAPEILELLCKVDPALPFDESMEDIELFLAALNQFPLILMEGRELDDGMRDTLLSHPELGEEARNVILECEA